ncbi:hypothetical protein I4U23_020261 [Adineta vaga]|nr:hypothetical protein I4U23_020261 [Adineta vaga]
MSSSSSVPTITLNLIIIHLYRFGGPILIVLGTISSIIMIILFLRKNFHPYPSSIYIICRNISNLFFIYLSILYETLALGYNITPSSSNLTYCRFSCYTTLLFDILNPFYLCLTLFDRLLGTSFNVNIRKYSTHQLAYRLSICGLICWILLHLHALFFSEIIQLESNMIYCYFQPGLYSTLMTYYSLIIKGILTPIVCLTFGLRIMKNYRKRCRLISISSVTIDEKNFTPLIRCQDRELIFLLLKDIIIYIIFSSLMSIFFIYELLTEHHTKNIDQREMEYYIRYLGIFCISIPFCIGFYTNLLISKTFRCEVKNLIYFSDRK